MISQTVITQPCYGAIDEMPCYLFSYAAASASRNVTSAKKCGNAVPMRFHPTKSLVFYHCKLSSLEKKTFRWQRCEFYEQEVSRRNVKRKS